jgi:GT2 family glycosyltransferase
MAGPEVTIVMSPRERFNLTQRSIESLYSDLSIPFDFICVDGNSPRAVRDYLRSEADRRGFKLIRTEHYLTPNEARNLAIAEAQTRYIVFVDNDVIFAPGWLEHLLRCAEETGAEVVGSLICIGEPVHTTIHFGGGEAEIAVKEGKRHFRETHRFYERPLSEVRDQLVRTPCEFAEFHSMLVKREVFEQLGPLDEHLQALFEHTDLCMLVRQRGGTVMFEPRSVVTYAVGSSLSFSELRFFFCRWSDEWSVKSEQHFHKKWRTVFNDQVVRTFVIPHRRRVLRWQRRAAVSVVGWRITEWLFDRFADVITWSAKRDRERALARKSPAASSPASRL